LSLRFVNCVFKEMMMMTTNKIVILLLPCLLLLQEFGGRLSYYELDWFVIGCGFKFWWTIRPCFQPNATHATQDTQKNCLRVECDA